MPHLSDPAIVDVEAMTVAAVRERVPMSQLPAFYDRVYGVVAGTLAAQGLAISGPALGIYFGQPTDTADVAAGFPIAGPADVVTPTDGVQALVVPAGRVAQVLYTGGYDGLGNAYEQLVGFIVSSGETPGNIMWEQYLTEPTPDADPETMQTLISWAVEAP